MKKYIFVDLDNTLICADYQIGGLPKNAKQAKLSDGTYWSRLRPGALKFLQELRNIDSVYMLTAATYAYACAWNNVFNLGFDEKYIFARDSTNYDNLKGLTGKTYLIDDLPAGLNGSKISVLLPIGNVKYIQMPKYNGYANQSLTKEKISGILKEIMDN